MANLPTLSSNRRSGISEKEIRVLVQEQIRQRRYEPVVRLEFGPGADTGIVDLMRGRFELTAEDLYELPAEVDFTTLFEIASLPIPQLRDSPWTPLVPCLCGEP